MGALAGVPAGCVSVAIGLTLSPSIPRHPLPEGADALVSVRGRSTMGDVNTIRRGRISPGIARRTCGTVFG
jgi:hypothetical protein